MAGMETLLNAVPLPLWATELVALALVVLALGLLFWLVPLRPLVGLLPQIALLTVMAWWVRKRLRERAQETAPTA